MDALSDDLGPDRPQGWIQWYCSLEGHEYLLQIEAEYIKDGFNLHGLLRQVNGPSRKMSKDRFRKCLSMILSPLAPN